MATLSNIDALTLPCLSRIEILSVLNVTSCSSDCLKVFGLVCFRKRRFFYMRSQFLFCFVLFCVFSLMAFNIESGQRVLHKSPFFPPPCLLKRQ